eukprot:scaffold1002_cov135-Skeletonema_dohrnii-CCMP3373.AAC.3
MPSNLQNSTESKMYLLPQTACILYISQSVYPFNWVCPTEKVLDIATEFGFGPSDDELWYHDDDKEKRKILYTCSVGGKKCEWTGFSFSQLLI